MKKIYALVMAVFFMFALCGNVLGAEATIMASEKYDVSQTEMKFVYTSTNGVTAGDNETFKIESLSYRGKITEIAFESSSTNCKGWVSESDNMSSKSTQSIILMEDINIGYSPGLNPARNYFNRDIPITSTEAERSYQYFTISPTTADTGTWILNVTWKKY